VPLIESASLETYVDVALLRKAQEIRNKYPMFCDICGIVNPPDHFYPLGIHGPDSISGLICNTCERELRAKAAQRDART